jgi:hypothetical protein
MNDSSVNKAWEFECVLESGKEIKSWFYSDTKEDASNRVKNFGCQTDLYQRNR